MRIVLATGLFAIGVELPQNYMAKHVKGLLVMVVPTMAFGWVIVAGMWTDNILYIILHLVLVRDYACFVPWSDVYFMPCHRCLSHADRSHHLCSNCWSVLLYSSICRINWFVFSEGGKFALQHVPLNLRRILSAESAANDGLAYPFLSISLYLTLESTRRAAIGKWFLVGWLCMCSFLILSVRSWLRSMQTRWSSV